MKSLLGVYPSLCFGRKDWKKIASCFYLFFVAWSKKWVSWFESTVLTYYYWGELASLGLITWLRQKHYTLEMNMAEQGSDWNVSNLFIRWKHFLAQVYLWYHPKSYLYSNVDLRSQFSRLWCCLSSVLTRPTVWANLFWTWIHRYF